MRAEPRPTSGPGQNSAELRTPPPLRLRHEELHAPTFGMIGAAHELYYLAAALFHHADELPINLRACFAYGLWHACPRAEGPHRGVRAGGKGTRYRAMRAHHWLYGDGAKPDWAMICLHARSIGWTEDEIRDMLPQWRQEDAPRVARNHSLAAVAASIDTADHRWSPEHTDRMAREYRAEAQAERRHAESGGHDDYGIPRVVLAYPDRDKPEDVPDLARLVPGWLGQAMLAVDPEQYRRELLLPKSFPPAVEGQPVEALVEDEEADTLRTAITGRERGLHRQPVRRAPG